MKRLTVMIMVLGGLASCIDSVELPIRSEKPQLVVDGLITNEKPPYQVRFRTPADSYLIRKLRRMKWFVRPKSEFQTIPAYQHQ